MKPLVIGILAAILITGGLAAGTDQPQDAERLFRAAMNTEQVDGNLRAAIEQYTVAALLVDVVDAGWPRRPSQEDYQPRRRHQRALAGADRRNDAAQARLRCDPSAAGLARDNSLAS